MLGLVRDGSRSWRGCFQGALVGSTDRLFSSSSQAKRRGGGSDEGDDRRPGDDAREEARNRKQKIRAARRSQRSELRRWRGVQEWDDTSDGVGAQRSPGGGARRWRTVDWYEAVLDDDKDKEDDGQKTTSRGQPRVKYKHRAGGNPKKKRERRHTHHTGDPGGTRAQFQRVLDEIFEDHAREFFGGSSYTHRETPRARRPETKNPRRESTRVVDFDDDFDWNTFEEFVFANSRSTGSHTGGFRFEEVFDEFFKDEFFADEFFTNGGVLKHGAGVAPVSRADCGDCVALGIPPGVALDTASLKGYLREKAKVWHPDRHPGETRADAEKQFKRCYSAFDSLMARIV